jgi:phage gpG-like protein
VLRNRLELAHNRANARDWAQERRARTRQLIELGGLLHKAGLIELLDDDRATLLGAMIELAEQLQAGGLEGKETASLKARWRRKGMRAFEAEKEV